MNEISTTSPTTTAATTKKKYEELKQNSTLIGCLGVALSTLTQLLALLALAFRNDISELLVAVQGSVVDQLVPETTMKIVVLIFTTLFGMSLINVVVSSLLLFGIAKNCCYMLFPWLLYHGLIFSVVLHLAVYFAISGIFMHFHCFLMAAMTFTSMLLIYFKIYSEVYRLFKVMDYEDQQLTKNHDSDC